MNRSWVGILLVLLLVASSFSGATAGTTGRAAVAAQQEFDSTEFHIHVYENGSARWTFRYKKTLNESNRQEFEAYAEEFNENETELYRTFRDRAVALTRSGTNVTDRQMAATGFSKRAYVTDLGNRGIVEMSFLWTNFAVASNDSVVVGDVFEGGLYVGPNQRLVIEQEPGLVRSAVEPTPDASSNDSVTWEGEREFADNRPRVVFATESAGGGAGNDGGRPTDGGETNSSSMLPWVALLVALLAGGLGLAWRQGLLEPLRRSGPPPAGAPGDEDVATGAAEAETEPESGAESGREAPAEGGEPAAEAEEPEPAPSPGQTEPAVSDEELMSDEERVEKLLQGHGGRMKQVNIVDETGWSKSKVSMLLSDMEEEGKISKLRIGRENVISLPGQEPGGAGSPFEEEGEG